MTSRFIADIPITFGDPMEFMKALDYSYMSPLLCFPFVGIWRPFNDAIL